MIERLCRAVARAIGTPRALVVAVLIQFIWVAVGQLTGRDPFPFVFLLTVSNIIQLCLIFVLAIGQQDSHEIHTDHFDALHAHIDEVKQIHAAADSRQFK